MAIAWVTLTAKMDTSTSVTYKPRMTVNTFGDGYQARIPDGINNMPRSMTVVYTNITASDHHTLVGYVANAISNGTSMIVPILPEDETGSKTGLFIFDPTNAPSFSADEGGALYNWTLPLLQVYGD